ncbi:NAD-dependent deacetylase [Nitratiruptor sp. YY08-26]|uniref:SIR2 family NAD-dependent protein deacylase n=1 Tax=unclassified Nitratiruptor TaxID=2624044 RepID=UPI001915EECF|nr:MULTISPECIES: Sir2 family NAD-dependent protein deacetylase [unclassified Nitratiruptor]BCD61258.1 NAD-dependent deacetylase [Nitratiruptor sp. YY08-13]BCD65191.1 NAD-dependent deacetylase [Nitratiruptor sp. YY08-26]
MKIYLLSGAGLSAPSGIPTYRDDGLWDEVAIEEVATHDAWLRNPQKVIAFFDKKRQELAYCKPNAAHFYFTKLQNCVHLTQNVDDLCERAGQEPVHLHGKLTEVRCDKCKSIWDIGYTPQPHLCHFCGSKSVRPNVILFGEVAPNYRYLYTTKADVFIAVGTSGAVIDIADIAQQFPVSILIDPKRRKRTTMFGEFDMYIDEYFSYFIQEDIVTAIDTLDILLKEIDGGTQTATK